MIYFNYKFFMLFDTRMILIILTKELFGRFLSDASGGAEQVTLLTRIDSLVHKTIAHSETA